MKKCPTCGGETKGGWNYCPMCGSKLMGNIKETGVYHLEKIRYLWERQRDGGLVYKNFKSIRQSGVHPFSKTKPIRIELGDFSHINLFNLRVYSFLYFSPKSVKDMYLIGKLEGYYSIESGLRTLRMGPLVSSLQKTGFFWKIFENEKIKEALKKGWVANGGAVLDSIKTNKKKGEVSLEIKDSVLSILPRMDESNCSIGHSILCGHAEAIFDGFWDGVEVKCEREGESSCEFKMYLHEREEEPIVYIPKKDEVQRVLESIIESVGHKRKMRKELDDFHHIITPQCYNYFLLSPSPGHAILSKHSGVICGKRLAEKKNISGEDNAFAYARELLLYLKAGILHEQTVRGDGLILLQMEESVYASGVNNIHMKLDVFLAGIIEGLLKKSTGEKWLVEEKKCLANGDEYCEFACSRERN